MTDEELIKRVAEEVMGWLKFSEEWNPITNLNHAVMVVERMRELGFTAVSLCNPWFDGAAKERKEWSVAFFSETKAIHGRNQYIGHAICLAALKAVENG